MAGNVDDNRNKSGRRHAEMRRARCHKLEGLMAGTDSRWREKARDRVAWAEGEERWVDEMAARLLGAHYAGQTRKKKIEPE